MYISLSIHIYIYIFLYISLSIHIYIYIYIEREIYTYIYTYYLGTEIGCKVDERARSSVASEPQPGRGRAAGVRYSDFRVRRYMNYEL